MQAIQKFKVSMFLWKLIGMTVLIMITYYDGLSCPFDFQQAVITGHYVDKEKKQNMINGCPLCFFPLLPHCYYVVLRLPRGPG